ncbi:hypothetical protein POVWA2_053860 [Plasmodium ovale wallikeri]|uniref:Uncharacterized protein n=1 Tax=Plasmodium ovale wallikeri TaxID=864142 RepID=A0A1A8ZT81_PLAOA|nr:hypothetical protein POVWA2_053860 [Plasmodium ovale wallikeri]SBT56648.1 hypothetical protein POVWA1_077490 [Plasmodium ovale wallikeri]
MNKFSNWKKNRESRKTINKGRRIKFLFCQNINLSQPLCDLKQVSGTKVFQEFVKCDYPSSKEYQQQTFESLTRAPPLITRGDLVDEEFFLNDVILPTMMKKILLYL